MTKSDKLSLMPCVMALVQKLPRGKFRETDHYRTGWTSLFPIPPELQQTQNDLQKRVKFGSGFRLKAKSKQINK